MKSSYHVAMVTAVALSASLLAPSPGLGQPTQSERARATAAEPRLKALLEAQARQLTVFDREGNVVNTIGERDTYSQPVFSPDRTRVAVLKRAQTWDFWVLDVATGNGTQMTSSHERERVKAPVWSPDGSQIAYVVVRGGHDNLYRRASNGEGEEELLYQHPGGAIILTDWSLDGRFLSFYSAHPFYSANLAESTLYLLPLDGDGHAIEIARSESIMAEARLSPDSRFLAYRSDETGRAEIVVRSVSLSGGANASIGTWQVSTDGGLGMASWRQDGRELYYFAADRAVMAVEVDTAQGFEFGRPRRLFTAPDTIRINAAPGGQFMGFQVAFGNVSRDGQRFLFAVPPAPQPRQITILDREGNVVSRLGEPGLYGGQPAFSPDGSRVAVIKHDLETGNDDVWTFDVATGDGMRVTADDSSPWKWAPVWSPDGTHVAYVSPRGQYEGIYSTASNGEGSEELLFRYTPGADMALVDYSANGREEYLSVEGGNIVLVVPLTGTDPLAREAIDVVREEYQAEGGWFSPDGRFLAYCSNESGRFEIYVRPFDPSLGRAPAEEQWQVTQGGAFQASWRQDGKELLYVTQDREWTSEMMVMAMDVTTTPDFQVGTPRLLFRVRPPGNRRPSMHISPDAQRFVFLMPVGDP